jgi:hypothetical protein
MWRIGHTYVHDYAPDIALEVLKVRFSCQSYVKVKARLVNRHNGLWYETKTYTIKRKDFNRWSVL